MYLCQPILWRNMCTMISRQVNNVSDMMQWRWCLFYLDQHAVHYNLQWNNSSREAGVLGRSTTAYYNCIPCTMQNDIISHTIWNMFYIYRNKKRKLPDTKAENDIVRLISPQFECYMNISHSEIKYYHFTKKWNGWWVYQ
jgi:hypothetical protein